MIIDGRKIAQGILDELKSKVSKLSFQPVFCDILVGNNPVSAQYVNMKGRWAEKVGIKFRRAEYPESISTEDLIEEIKKINQEPNICGLIVQLPLPSSIDRKAVLDAIDPEIDVDCTSSINSNKFYSGQGFLQFPTAAAVMAILDSLNLDLSKKNFLVVGQGELVGKPVVFLLRQRNMDVQIADINTPNVPELLKNADVIISAVGKAKLIIGQNIKPGGIVVDAGTSESGGGVVGDVDFESVSKAAGFVSPVPGGVGPVTVAKLLENVYKVAEKK